MARRPRAAAIASPVAAAFLALGACRSAPSRVTAPTPRPSALPTAAPSPAATPPAASVPTPPASPEIPVRDDTRPPVVRVLLHGVGSPAFPEPGRRYVCVGDAGPTLVRGPLTASVEGGRPAIQVGAYVDPANAKAALARLVAAGFAGQVLGEGEALARPVALARAGESGDALAARLAAAGFADQKRIASAAGGQVTVQGEGGAAAAAERLRIVPVDPDPVRVGGKWVRGEFELRAGGEGLAVIDVVSLEAYLRGVVPAEMGPRTFASLDALKAQAVAARTYAVAHLGDHSADGWDLCDTPFCQDYEGVGVEHPLSDQAIRETAGEIVTYQGRPIDAMYHSTCAGHTEDGGAVFPQREQPYLKGVPCRGEGSLAIGTGRSPGPWLGPLAHLVAVGEALAHALGAAPTAAALSSRLTGQSVKVAGAPALLRAFGLEPAAALLRLPSGPVDEETVRRLLALYRLPLPDAPRGTPRAAVEMAAAVRLAQLAGRVQTLAGRVLPSPAGIALVRDGQDPPRGLAGVPAVLERRGERWRSGAVSFHPGSAATLWCVDALCPVVEVEPLDDADGASAWTWWVRELTLDDIGHRLATAGVRSVRVTRRGVSGRALAVEVEGAAGVREFPGLAFRRALELPDTLFVPVARADAAPPAIRFVGRGWGHGVGMCQNGAYGLARGGAGYVEILKTYYTGVEIARWEGGDHERHGPR